MVNQTFMIVATVLLGVSYCSADTTQPIEDAPSELTFRSGVLAARWRNPSSRTPQLHTSGELTKNRDLKEVVCKREHGTLLTKQTEWLCIDANNKTEPMRGFVDWEEGETPGRFVTDSWSVIVHPNHPPPTTLEFIVAFCGLAMAVHVVLAPNDYGP